MIKKHEIPEEFKPKSRKHEDSGEFFLSEKEYKKLKSLATRPDPCDGRTARVFDWLDVVLTKATKFLMWIMESLAFIYAFKLLGHYETGLQMIKSGLVDQGIAYTNAVQIATSSTSNIVIALGVGIPTIISGFKTLKKSKWYKSSSKVAEEVFEDKKETDTTDYGLK